MFPSIDLFGIVSIHTFGLCMSIAMLLFFTGLYYHTSRSGMNRNIFKELLSYTIAIFFFGRLFYIITEWVNLKFMFQDVSTWEFIKNFFLMQNYNLSLMGGGIGFFLVFWWKSHIYGLHRVHIHKYLDIIVLSFMTASIIGYVGSLLGGQIYGTPTSLPIGIIYTHPDVPYTQPVFPLPVFYAIIMTLASVILFQLHHKYKVDGFAGYVGMIIFGGMLFLGEFMNGSEDIFKSIIFINLNQIGAIIIAYFGIKGFMELIKI